MGNTNPAGERVPRGLKITAVAELSGYRYNSYLLSGHLLGFTIFFDDKKTNNNDDYGNAIDDCNSVHFIPPHQEYDKKYTTNRMP